jgi:glycosyltransferase involved in cell wall biosynthesis
MAGTGHRFVRVAVFAQGFAYGRGRATTVVELVAPLARRGHTVDVFVPSPRFVQPVDASITVQPQGQYRSDTPYDVVIYNSGLPSGTLGLINRARAKRVMLQHSYQTNDPGLRLADLVWYPSHACAAVDKGSRYRKIVVPPPIDPDRYRTKPGSMVGLSLSSPWKGGAVVAAVARSLPQHRFLVVKDGRGNGVSLFRGLANVELVEFMEPRDFYSRCKVQVFPSRSESYGRVGVEGAVSGIPLVASKDPGIREAMAGHGIYVARTDIPTWTRTVNQLMTNRKAWKAASADVSKRAAKITYQRDQVEFCLQVESLVK